MFFWRFFIICSISVDILPTAVRRPSPLAVLLLFALKVCETLLSLFEIRAMQGVLTEMFVPPTSAAPVRTALCAPSTCRTETAARTLLELITPFSAEGGLYQDSVSLVGYNDTSSPDVSTTFGVVA